ncbi:MAG TPA: serine/threonine protein kinase [Blastocatellia bacterium]|nr:serine/threonine protein kinase [Blastocatellia bacterium]
MPELRLENSIVDDRYLVDRCLGRGSYAEIFLASDNQRGANPVIIKALNMTLQGTPDIELEQTLVENFQNEAIALDKVRHANIIRRLGHGTAADLRGTPFHYLVLEYMPGGDLLDLCRRRPFSLDDALFYFRQVAEALAYAHSQGVIHRDIKPNNLLLSADKKIVKVADFGVAKMGAGDSDEITRVGTNVYAPPEHHPDSNADDFQERLTPSADIYSLAKTIYTAMTGRAPRLFSRQPITELPAELAGQDWSDELLAILRKATSTRVANRYNSMQEFWQDFAELRLEKAARQGAQNEGDSEETVVRSRLSGTSTVERAVPRPNFQAITIAREGTRPQKARIVVDLPEHGGQVGAATRRMPGADSPHGSFEGQAGQPGAQTHGLPESLPDPQAAAANRARMAGREVVRAEVVEQAGLKNKEAAAFQTRKVRADGTPEPTFFDNLRVFVGSEWLRRIFIIFMIIAMIGLTRSVYLHYAGQRRTLPSLPTIPDIFRGKEGLIANPNVSYVNLRSEPSRDGNIMVRVPNGTRVRVVDNQGGWVKIKVLEWSGGQPDNSPDDGWIDGRFVRFD